MPRPLHQQIDDLRELLNLPDRTVASVVMLKGLVDRTPLGGHIREIDESGDVAIIFVGPKEQLGAVIREDKEDGSLTFRVTMPSSGSEDRT